MAKTIVTVDQGGTGAETLTDGGVLLGSGTGAVTATAVLADGEILVGDGTTDPVALDVGSSTAITVLGTVATGTWNGTAIANANLANSAVTVGTTSISLGASATTLAGLTSVTSTGFTGDLTGDVTGDVSGSSGSCTGNAATVTNGVYTTNNLSVLAATTSAQLAGVISDETGSGALVFATSPTLVTPALGTPASGVATNLTGTASSLTAGTVTTNANLTGDVTSSGNATTIATDAVDIAMLSATGTASSSTYLRGDNAWATPAGGGGSPSGIAGAVQFSDGSAFDSDATKFFWDDSNKRLGIGTAVPTVLLHTLDGAIVFEHSSSNLLVDFESSDSTILNFANDGAGESTIFRTNRYFKFETGETSNALVIEADGGYIGIGTAAPNANVQIGSSAATGSSANPALQVGGGATYRLGFYTTAEGAIIENRNGDDGISFHTKTAGEAMQVAGLTGRVTVKKSSNSEITALTSSSASVAIELDDANNFSHTITEDTTLANPTSTPVPGQSGCIVITQGGVGDEYTMDYGSQWHFEGGTAPEISSFANSIDNLVYYVAGTTSIHAVLLKDIKTT